MKGVLCLLRAKNLLNSNEPEEKDVQPSNLNSQKASQGIISNPLIPATIASPPPFSVYTPTTARIINTEKDPPCFPQPINLVNSQLTQLKTSFEERVCQ